MLKKYDFLVYIGRFQPFHNGHKEVIKRGLELAEKILVLVGSSQEARTYRNPFTFNERVSMISSCFFGTRRLLFYKLPDVLYNDQKWIEQIQSIILNNFNGNTKNLTIHGYKDMNIGLIGCNKDNSSYYLKLFPNWNYENIEYVENIDGTKVRNIFFKDENKSESLYLSTAIPDSVFKFLSNFRMTMDYSKIRSEYNFVNKYKSSWDAVPYPPTFITTDAVVIQSGYILLVKRKAYPGKGLWALPGGFLKQFETLEEGVIRELREETKIKVPEPVLKGSIKTTKVYDNPYRSSRGRTVTHAFLINLTPQLYLPKIKGSDDAEKAKWFLINNISPEILFEDHYYIIQDMLGKV